jgi:hypothetical protein
MPDSVLGTPIRTQFSRNGSSVVGSLPTVALNGDVLALAKRPFSWSSGAGPNGAVFAGRHSIVTD